MNINDHIISGRIISGYLTASRDIVSYDFKSISGLFTMHYNTISDNYLKLSSITYNNSIYLLSTAVNNNFLTVNCILSNNNTMNTLLSTIYYNYVALSYSIYSLSNNKTINTSSSTVFDNYLTLSNSIYSLSI